MGSKDTKMIKINILAERKPLSRVIQIQARGNVNIQPRRKQQGASNQMNETFDYQKFVDFKLERCKQANYCQSTGI